MSDGGSSRATPIHSIDTKIAWYLFVIRDGDAVHSFLSRPVYQSKYFQRFWRMIHIFFQVQMKMVKLLDFLVNQASLVHLDPLNRMEYRYPEHLVKIYNPCICYFPELTFNFIRNAILAFNYSITSTFDSALESQNSSASMVPINNDRSLTLNFPRSVPDDFQLDCCLGLPPRGFSRFDMWMPPNEVTWKIWYSRFSLHCSQCLQRWYGVSRLTSWRKWRRGKLRWVGP